MRRGVPTLAAALAVLAMQVAPAAAAAAPRAALRVLLDPPRLTLGAEPRAVIRVEGAGEATPRLAANVGRVEGLRAIGPGAYEARYVPPEASHPQVAIVSAIAADGRFGSALLPLVGQGEAIVRTSPRASIRVEVAGAPFGPATADERGLARVPILVPPGTRFAIHGGRPIAIPAPEPNLVHAAADRDLVRADAPAEVTVWVAAAADDGSRRDLADVVVAVMGGAVAEQREVAPGVLRVRWAHAAGRAGTATLRAWLAGRPSSVAEVRVERAPGPAAVLEVLLGRASWSADDGRPVPFAVVARDAAQNGVPDRPAVAASFGAVERLDEDGVGRWRGLLAVPAALGGRGRVELVARAGAVEGRASMALLAGRPERLAVEVPARPVKADGESDAVLRVVALDASGNRADAGRPALRAARGTLSAPEREAGGSYRVAWRPPAAREAWVEEVEVESGALRGVGRVAVEPASRFALSPSLGYAVGTGGLRSPFVGVEAARWGRLRGEEVALAAGAGWLRFDRGDAAAPGIPALHGRAELVALVLSGVWRRELSSFSAWAGAGAGAARVDSQLTVGSLPSTSAAGWAPAAQLRAGAGRRTRLGTPFVEARLSWLGDASLATLSGSFTVFSLALGWNLEL